MKLNQANYVPVISSPLLASQKGVEPIEIALAYVLAQPFPAQPLVGPRSLEELDSCILASELELTNEEVVYLRDGDGARRGRRSAAHRLWAPQ